METLAELALRAPDSHPEATALRSVGDPDREYDYRRLRTDARKTSNVLARRGIRDGRTLGIAAEPVPETALGLLGASLVGAVVRLDPPREVDARGVLAPSHRIGEYDLPAGGQPIGYGDDPGDPAVAHFEEEMWAENPTSPPPTVGPEDPVLATDEATVTHGELVAMARRAIDRLDPKRGDAIAVRAPLASPAVVAAGVVAPLASGATVLLPAAGNRASQTGTVAVVTDSGEASEETTYDPRDLTT